VQVATAAVVVPHPEKVAPNSKARIHRDFGYGGEDSYYSGWGPRRVLICIADSAGRKKRRKPLEAHLYGAAEALRVPQGAPGGSALR